MLALLCRRDVWRFSKPPPAPQDTTKRDTTKVKLDSLPLKDGSHGELRNIRRHVALARRVAGRQDDRLRAARRSLHDPDWRAAAHAGSPPVPPPSIPAALVARRQAHRLLSDRSGAENVWLCDPDGLTQQGAHEGNEQLSRVAGLDARRQLHRRIPAQRGVGEAVTSCG